MAVSSVMKRLKLAFVGLMSLLALSSSNYAQNYPKVKIADGYVQVEKVNETKLYLEISVYNSSTEIVYGLVTVMRPKNLSNNQMSIKIYPGKIESVLFAKEDRNTIVTWEEIKLHDFSKARH